MLLYNKTIQSVIGYIHSVILVLSEDTISYAGSLYQHVIYMYIDFHRDIYILTVNNEFYNSADIWGPECVCGGREILMSV